MDSFIFFGFFSFSVHFWSWSLLLLLTRNVLTHTPSAHAPWPTPRLGNNADQPDNFYFFFLQPTPLTSTIQSAVRSVQAL
jgi:hypothetical protein